MESNLYAYYDHIYSKDIYSMWAFYENPSHFKNMFASFITDFTPDKDVLLTKIGSKFNYKFKNLGVKLEVDKIIIKENYRKMRHVMTYLLEVPVKSFLTYEFFSDSSNMSTIVRTGVSECTDDGLKFLKEVFSPEDFSYFTKDVENYINTYNTSLKIQESIIVNVNFERLWKILLNFKEYVKIAPLIAFNVEYKEYGFGEGSEVRVFLKDQVILDYLVTKCEVKFNKGMYTLKLINSSIEIPIHSVTYKLLPVSRNKCFLEYSQTYENELPLVVLERSRDIIEAILKSIRDYFIK